MDWLATSFKTNNTGVLYITHYIVSCARITLHPFQSKPECIITYNTSATSCPRVPSSKLSGIIALSTQWRRYYSIIYRTRRPDLIIMFKNISPVGTLHIRKRSNISQRRQPANHKAPRKPESSLLTGRGRYNLISRATCTGITNGDQ